MKLGLGSDLPPGTGTMSRVGRIDSSSWQPTDPIPITVHGSERLCALFAERLSSHLPVRDVAFESSCRKRTFNIPVLNMEIMPFALLQAGGVEGGEIHRIP